MNKNTLVGLASAFAAFLLFGGSASAHVVVTPKNVGIGAFQTFTMSVPSEKNVATKELDLVLPEGLNYVTPTVKPGWTVTVKKSGTGENAKATEIIWKGGSIPGFMRDDFSFSAKVPATVGTLKWVVHQFYADGSMVMWHLAPNETQPKKADGTLDFSEMGPYSATQVVDDLSPTPTGGTTTSTSALVISIIALVLSLIALSRRRRSMM